MWPADRSPALAPCPAGLYHKRSVPSASALSSNDPASSPLRRDAEANRRRILAAAAEAFADQGLDVPVDEIARRAGVGMGTLYRRFPTKAALVEAIFEEHLDRLAALAEEALREEDAWRGLAGFLERTVALQAENRGLCRDRGGAPARRAAASPLRAAA